jgi:hypothetical protein
LEKGGKNLVATKPKAKFELMEELLQKQQAGTLAEHVRDSMKACK